MGLFDKVFRRERGQSGSDMWFDVYPDGTVKPRKETRGSYPGQSAEDLGIGKSQSCNDSKHGRCRGFLERRLSYLEYRPGEEVDGNKGHTIITALKLLPSMGEDLTEEIWAYCENPRAQSKIVGKFRRHGDAEVLSAIKLLVKQKRLGASAHGTVRLYQAT